MDQLREGRQHGEEEGNNRSGVNFAEAAIIIQVSRLAQFNDQEALSGSLELGDNWVLF
jgi:hypothetical protein